MINTANSPYIIEAITENFNALVIENSDTGPVLVNFWSSKAGPCLRLYPVLDQLVHHYKGRLLLVNVDTEKELRFTKQYGIASVPTLKLFRYGEVVETLHGYQSEGELKKVMDRYVARDSDLQLANAIQLYTEGQAKQAYEAIAEAIVDDPVNPRIPLAMCKLLRHEGRYAEAIRLLDTLPDNIRQDKEINQLYDMLGFYLEVDTGRDIDALQTALQDDPDNLEIMKQLCVHYVMHQEYELALQQLVNIMEIDAGFEQNYAQKAMLKIFNILGKDTALVSRYRLYLKRYTH